MSTILKQIEEKTTEMLRDQQSVPIKLSKKIEGIKEDHRKQIIKFSGEPQKQIL